MTHQIPARKPLDSAIFFKTMRGLHPSKKQLEDLAVVERQAQARDAVSVKDSANATMRKGLGQSRSTRKF